MSQQMGIRANFASYDQAGADMGSYAGSTEEDRARLMDLCKRQLANMDGGMGSEQHNAVMRQVEKMVDEHINNVRLQQTGTGNAGSTLHGAGVKIQNTFGASAL